MTCPKCKKKTDYLYLKVKMTTELSVEVDSGGNEGWDYGGYNLAEDFIANMLSEKSRRVIGCPKCIK